MKRLLLVLALCVPLLAASAQAAASRHVQPEAPAITAFTTSATQVNRAALDLRTARVPVAWNTANRPVIANLLFDQILANGDAINVEIPRLVRLAPSSGEGVVAPILPPGSATQITLRLRMVNILTRRVYDEQQIVLPITDEGDPGGPNTDRPAITAFNSCCATVAAGDLQAGTARIPVEWVTVNRPLTTNLVFEQVLPNGEVVNVELPREDRRVIDSGEGVIAPVWPGEGVTETTLRVRLIDLLNGRVYDQRELPLIIGVPAPPEIISFSTTAPAVNADTLGNRRARVPVAWETSNRPENSNIVFEQVMTDGNILNIELPRGNPIVPSSGSGVVAPIPPGGEAAEVVLRLRLLDLATGETYAQRDLTIPITTEPVGEPEIASFSTNIATVDPAQLADATARVTIFWQVNNRPEASNVVFEQVMPDGQAINVELPRPEPIVPTAGMGVVAPLAVEGADAIVLRARLIDTASGSTYHQREITIPIG